MPSTRALLAALLAALTLGGFTTSAHAARTVTGISDQGDNFDWPIGAGVYAENMGSKFQHARYIVPWSVALRPGTTNWRQMDAWYQRRLATGKRMLVSFNHWDGCREIVEADPSTRYCYPELPSLALYRDAIATFRRTWPEVDEFTAWNEPNLLVYGWVYTGGVWTDDAWQMNPDETAAADFYKALHDECAVDRGAGTCLAVAGDFSDSSGAMGTYPTTYKSRISSVHGITPSTWAVHAHAGVNRDATMQWIGDFFSRVAPASSTWITEVGVKVCDRSLPWVAEATQATHANRLVSLMNAHNPARTYYYMMFGSAQDPGTGNLNCQTGGKWDSGLTLFDPSRPQLSAQPRPALHILFPELAGMYRGIRDQNTTGPHERGFVFAGRGVPVVGDWNGDGVDTPGTYDNGVWRLRNSNSDGYPDVTFTYGDSTHVPVVGDWDGDGDDTVGVWAPSSGHWYLRNANSPGTWDHDIQFGDATMKPVPGDWNGDGVDTIGVFNADGWWFLRDLHSGGTPHYSFQYGVGADRPFVGNWDGVGTADGVGIFSPYSLLWNLRDSASSGSPTIAPFYMGVDRETRIVGDFDGGGPDTTGIVR